MQNAARRSGAFRIALQHGGLARAGGLHLDEIVPAILRHDAEHLLVESEGAFGVADRNGEMGEAVRLDHALYWDCSISCLNGGSNGIRVVDNSVT